MIPRVPTVFGHEFAGTVSAVGAGVARFREGDRIVAANSAPCGQCRPVRARPPQPVRGPPLRQRRLWGVHRPAAAPGGGQHRPAPSRRARGAGGLRRAAGLCPARHRARRRPGRADGPGPRARAAWLPARDGRRGPRGPRDHGRATRAGGSNRCAPADRGSASMPRRPADVVADIRERARTGAGPRCDRCHRTAGGVGAGRGCRRARGWWCSSEAVRRARRSGSTPVACTTRSWRCSGAFHHTPATIRRAVALLESGSLVPDALITHRMAPRRGAGGAGPDGQERGAQGADRAVSAPVRRSWAPGFFK